MAPISSKTKEEIMAGNLRDLKEIFDKYNIKFWLDWGTLLGAVRDKKILPWDKDIDLGAMSEEYQKIMSTPSEVKKREFFMSELPIPIPNTNLLFKKFSFHRQGVTIDVLLYTKEGENIVSFLAPGKAMGSQLSCIVTRGLWLLWYSLVSSEINPDSWRRLIIVRLIQFFSFWLPFQIKNWLIKLVKKTLMKRKHDFFAKKVVIPQYYFQKLDNMEFYGMTFNIPFSVENYLKYKYGENWRLPDRKWDFKNDGAII